MAGRGRLKVRLEWLFIESDLTPDTDTERDGVEHIWNVVAPRADVTGRIEIENGHKTKIDTCHFRGSGYHDKRCGNGVFLSRFAACEWGRVHFPDSTAAYLVGKDAVSSEPFAKLLIIRDNELRLRDATVETQGTSRSSAGLRYDHKITMRSEDALELKMRPVRTVRSGIYLLRFICEATLKLRDGRPRKTFGLSSHLSIRRLRQRWLTKLTDLMTIREKTK